MYDPFYLIIASNCNSDSSCFFVFSWTLRCIYNRLHQGYTIRTNKRIGFTTRLKNAEYFCIYTVIQYQIIPHSYADHLNQKPLFFAENFFQPQFWDVLFKYSYTCVKSSWNWVKSCFHTIRRETIFHYNIEENWSTVTMAREL